MNELVNYCNVIEMSDTDKRLMFSKCTKKELIEMLIECNKHLNYLVSIYNNLPPITLTDVPIKPWEFNYP